jgi:hypothetical protein
MEVSTRKRQILDWILEHPEVGISDILQHLPDQPPVSTVNRDLKSLVDNHLLLRTGRGRSTVYMVAPAYRLIYSNIGDSYFDKDVDERKGNKRIDSAVFAHLEKVDIFTKKELYQLNGLQKDFEQRIHTLPIDILRKERNRLTIELSWKSSQSQLTTAWKAVACS